MQHLNGGSNTKKQKNVRNGHIAQAPRSIDCAIQKLIKNKIAEDKLARCKQIKDVSYFNGEFWKILLNIPIVTIEQQLVRYARGFNTERYSSVVEVMCDSERVKTVQRSFGKSAPKFGNHVKDTPLKASELALMDSWNLHLEEMT